MNRANTFESARQGEARCELCPLSCVQAGVAVRIKRLCAAPELQDRLRELGLGEDQIIKLLDDWKGQQKEHEKPEKKTEQEK